MESIENSSIFDKSEWDDCVAFYKNISSVVNDPKTNMQHKENAQILLKKLIKNDPCLTYYDYRIRNPKKEGYYRRRLEQFLSDSDSEDEENAIPNKYLFMIEQNFIKDMKRRFCDAEGYCWNHNIISCRNPDCKKKHELYEPSKKQMLNYFELYVPK